MRRLTVSEHFTFVASIVSALETFLVFEFIYPFAAIAAVPRHVA